MAFFVLRRDPNSEEWADIVTMFPGISFYKKAENTIYARPQSGQLLNITQRNLREFKKYLKKHDILASG